MATLTMIDEYLAGLAADKRAALEKVRKSILAVVPNAQEWFSYRLPAFRDDGGLVAAFGASANHCAYYPMSGSVVAALKRDLKDYDASKGAIRFDAANPLPEALVSKLMKARRAENAATATAKRPAKRAAPCETKARLIREAQAGATRTSICRRTG